MKQWCATISGAVLLVTLAACSPDVPSPSTSDTGAPASNDDHGAHEGAPIELGEIEIAGFRVRAARDSGALTPGGELIGDFWVTPVDPKVVAVRFWVGNATAQGSVKARADLEVPPNHWHQHAEIPNPLPPESRLWVELEVTGQGKQAGSIELR
ncbi:MAG: hypothetical protein AB7O52_10830 [Planctomycetota bacterium]